MGQGCSGDSGRQLARSGVVEMVLGLTPLPKEKESVAGDSFQPYIFVTEDEEPIPEMWQDKVLFWLTSYPARWEMLVMLLISVVIALVF